MTSPPGPLADEAARLLEALQQWVADHLGRAGAAPSDTGRTPGCQLCPVCQVLSLLRGCRPEVFEHLLDASASLVAAVRAATEQSGRSAARAGRPPVQHIHVG